MAGIGEIGKRNDFSNIRAWCNGSIAALRVADKSLSLLAPTKRFVA